MIQIHEEKLKNEQFENFDKKSSKMKIKYSSDPKLHCGIISTDSFDILIDHYDKDKIINSGYNLAPPNNEKDVIGIIIGTTNKPILDFLYENPCGKYHYSYKIKKNIIDLRKDNVNVYHYYHPIVEKKYDIIDYHEGHFIDVGKETGVEKNPIWIIRDDENDEYYMMYCETNTLCKLCKYSYQKILDYEENYNDGKKITWYKANNGYIMSGQLDGKKRLYIHQIIMDCHGNGRGTKNISVDHIDRDPLNNTLTNLRIADRKDQENNSKGIAIGTKRARKKSAKILPDGITQNMMRKYVVYYHQYLDKEHTKPREYFAVEHPKLDKRWESTKSGKITALEKLNQANKVVDDLENDVFPEKEDKPLPKYISFSNARGKTHLVFEKRMDGKRMSIRMILPESYDIDERIAALIEKVKVKYEIDMWN
jgi:hypothetical protein